MISPVSGTNGTWQSQKNGSCLTGAFGGKRLVDAAAITAKKFENRMRWWL
jgi:hypothetical protein